MTAENSELCEWATALIDKRISTFEKRRKHAIASGLDGEALHDVRTSGRRLRSALEDLGPLVKHAAKNRHRAKAIGDVTGDARDLAVLIAKLSSYRALAGLRERREIDSLVSALSRRERRALRRAEHAVKHSPGAKLT
jgi:CHAD domain-containing protein